MTQKAGALIDSILLRRGWDVPLPPKVHREDLVTPLLTVFMRRFYWTLARRCPRPRSGDEFLIQAQVVFDHSVCRESLGDQSSPGLGEGMGQHGIIQKPGDRASDSHFVARGD
jgi:hypothetical protein